MHEFSLAQGLHDQLVDLALKHGKSKVIRAEITVGKNAGIVAESFSFGIKVLKEQHKITKGMQINIIEDDGQDLVLQQVELE
ncbi:MAG: hypothetical protein CSB24_04210 [Deltaproteobacteria bacterium]|nr:MAG: hypothetical protein CSB24_04210 [Deltaproteobacteria bacterium]